ncbi:hypothetical protein K0M31_012034 [Melipona bicolor]|uniref:Uncharacterized protein n=1 Tax=Melipona bicolor TaxID=60889 RepID=A0AA40GAX5_9HYME|nr:hypothetical protein K0M31_012034 [Melipona bicolor]
MKVKKILQGPENKVRRLYIGVIKSMILNGAPIWSTFVSKVLKETGSFIEQKCIRSKITNDEERCTSMLAVAYNPHTSIPVV